MLSVCLFALFFFSLSLFPPSPFSLLSKQTAETFSMWYLLLTVLNCEVALLKIGNSRNGKRHDTHSFQCRVLCPWNSVNSPKIISQSLLIKQIVINWRNNVQQQPASCRRVCKLALLQRSRITPWDVRKSGQYNLLTYAVSMIIVRPV